MCLNKTELILVKDEKIYGGIKYKVCLNFFKPNIKVSWWDNMQEASARHRS